MNEAVGTAPGRLPIVAFATLDWDGLWMNRQHLLSRLGARGHRVAYSNGLAHYSEIGQLPWLQATEFRDNVTLMRRGYLWPRTYRASLLTRVAVHDHIRRIRRALGLAAHEPCVGLCFDPTLLDLMDALQPAVKAFHIYDAYNRYTSWHQPSDLAEVREHIQRFDLVTASTPQMYECFLGSRPAPECVIPNGVDFAEMREGASRSSPVIEAIRALPRPRFGYTGTINAKVDYALLGRLAAARPQASFVIVGPLRPDLLRHDAEARADFEALHRRPNVHFMNAVKRAEIPAVLDAMDVNALFLRVERGDWVSFIYPLKLNEYLATGKPIVSSAIDVVCREFGDVVTVCRTDDEWLAALDRGAGDVSAEDAATRRGIASANDWTVRVAQYEALLLAAAARSFPGWAA